MAEERETGASESETAEARPVRTKSKSTPKSQPTPKAKAAASKPRQGVTYRIARFIRQILDELRKVVRPTGPEWRTYTLVVIAFVVAIMVIVFGMDFVFTKLVSLVFGGNSS